jgi:hypothetical protein
MIHRKGGGTLWGLRIKREILILRKPPIEVVLLYSVSTKYICLNITQGCQHPTNVMTYTTAAKTDTHQLESISISFGDGVFSKKNDSHGSDLSFNFNRSSRRGECGLSNIYSEDLLIVMTVMTNRMCFPH